MLANIERLLKRLIEIDAARVRAKPARRLATAIDDKIAQERLRARAKELDRRVKALEANLPFVNRDA
jgi:hypothetical protein